MKQSDHLAPASKVIDLKKKEKKERKDSPVQSVQCLPTFLGDAGDLMNACRVLSCGV